MTNQENSTEDFITGLKAIIRASWPTQEEFARGVTSKVNMSNILRGSSGTSYTMRKALADKAGMSVDEIVEFGKMSTRRMDSRNSPFFNEDSALGNNPIGGSMNELMSLTSELTLGLQSNVAQYAKALIGMVQSITNERDKLLKLLSQEQNIANTLSDGIKIVTAEKKILYVNRVMMEKFHTTPGDNCASGDNCTLCNKVNCIVSEVFNNGKISRRIVEREGELLFVTAYPITDSDWKITQVLVVISLGSIWTKLLAAQGWTAPSAVAEPVKVAPVAKPKAASTKASVAAK